MTVSYSYAVSTASVFTFWKLMACWKGSIWKLVFKEMIFWFAIYVTIALTFHLALKNEESRIIFRQLVMYCRVYHSTTEVMLMLGFFTTLVIGRFWEIYQCVHWPDNSALALATYLRSNEDNEADIRILRKTCARYLMLCFILIFRDVSKPIRNRFPDLKLLVACNLLTENELMALEQSLANFPSTGKYWVPIEWLLTILKRHYAAGKNRSYPSLTKPTRFASHMDQYSYNDVIREILKYRAKLSDILSYDWVPIPLAYTQMCVLVVYMHVLILILVQQVVNEDPNAWEFVQPVLFCSIELLIMIGWIKSAAVLLNPFGDDDDDLELNWLIDRHWKTIFKMLKRPMINCPTQVPGLLSNLLPHTIASRILLQKKKPNPMVGSVAKMKVNKAEAQIIDEPTMASLSYNCSSAINVQANPNEPDVYGKL